MSTLSYIEHLNIPIKYKGSILHSYEYNATVEKINEIVDNLQVSYDLLENSPNFTVTNNPLASVATGTGVTINDSKNGKLYPITSTSYVVTDDGKTLETELEEIKNNISNNYSEGNGIHIDDEHNISVKPEEFIDNHSIYLNSYGQLVVNNEVVLQGAEERFTFINERGEWVGDMANVKNYIDSAYSYLKDDINDIYTYMMKFTEYDEYGKNYQLSEEFINSQE